MRAIVFGGRDFNNRRLGFRALNQIHEKTPITCVISGTARGADTIGELWAAAHGIPIERYKPDWAKYGRAAGIIRNRDMAEQGNPDCGICFPGGNGTYHMKKTLKEMGIKVYTIVPAGGLAQ